MVRLEDVESESESMLQKINSCERFGYPLDPLAKYANYQLVSTMDMFCSYAVLFGAL